MLTMHLQYFHGLIEKAEDEPYLQTELEDQVYHQFLSWCFTIFVWDNVVQTKILQIYGDHQPQIP